MTEGYSMSGSQANRVALKPAGTLSGGNRFSVAGPVRGARSPARPRTPARAMRKAEKQEMTVARLSCFPAFLIFSLLHLVKGSDVCGDPGLGQARISLTTCPATS